MRPFVLENLENSINQNSNNKRTCSRCLLQLSCITKTNRNRNIIYFVCSLLDVCRYFLTIEKCPDFSDP